MAVIHKGESDLGKKVHYYRILAVIWCAPTVLYMLLFFLIGFHFPGFTHLLAIVPAAFGGSFYNKSRAYKAGETGEKRTVDMLSHLPDSYHVFTSVPLQADGKRGEADMLVVGDNGIFVIEVKGMNGSVEGSVEDHQWTQHKIGRKGGRYSKKIKSPVKQVSREVWLLSEKFKQRGIRDWIQGCVL